MYVNALCVARVRHLTTKLPKGAGPNGTLYRADPPTKAHSFLDWKEKQGNSRLNQSQSQANCLVSALYWKLTPPKPNSLQG